MGYWKSRGLRGSAFEDIINLSNEHYREANLAVIQKIPTPIVPLEMDKEGGIIRKAYFDKKSTVDYIGVMDKTAICFDAKETGKPYLPFANIHPHQVAFMKEFSEQGGLAFLLVHFTEYGRYFLLPVEVLVGYYEGDERKSVPIEAFEEEYEIAEPSPYLFYLGAVMRYRKNRQEKEKEA